jgi:hypothetical protein
MSTERVLKISVFRGGPVTPGGHSGG